MIDPVNESDAYIGNRLLDFFDSRSPWHRRLWNAGLCLTLREVLEAAEALRSGVLSRGSFKALVNAAQELAGRDPGAGTAEERNVLRTALLRALKSQHPMDGLDYHVVAQAESRSSPAYLARWANALRETDLPLAELAARSIASHLLDIGYSSDFLHRWWTRRLRHERGIRSMADIVDDAQQLALQHERDFEVMAPVSSAIQRQVGRPPDDWHSAEKVSAWLRSNGFDVKGVRQDGGFLFTISALDPEAAVARVSEVLDQLSARVAVGTRRDLAFLGRVWIKGVAEPHQTARVRRGVWVEALKRENQLYDARSTGGIHAAIELLSHLQSSSPGAAVAGGWAAIEALLSESENRAQAADRLAMLVACSYPRAEFTVLSYAIPKNDTRLDARLRGVDENRRRCDIVVNALRLHEIDRNNLTSPERTAVVRISAVLDNPRQVLAAVQKYATLAILRLYRQRNLVLHGGKTDAVALRAGLRTAAPIVGAGIDRIVHANYVDGISPLQLVARAQLALATVGTLGGPPITDLLG